MLINFSNRFVFFEKDVVLDLVFRSKNVVEGGRSNNIYISRP